MPTFKDWKQLIDAATWAVLIERKATHFGNYEDIYKQMLGRPGAITDKYRQYRVGEAKFALNCAKPPAGFTPTHATQHQWIFPLADTVRFYGMNGKYLGSMINGKVMEPPYERADENLFYKPGSLIALTSTPSITQEIRSMFHTNAVRTKAGWKAQVVYGDADNHGLDELPVVWESDATYVNDTEGEKKVTGESKAHEAAGKAVDQALESLFAKIKV